ncbi:MAG: histone deacetylase [Desulfopila sp.]|jgi:acetoin utilization deacetylase AcuC-like enzyme|nr:histone deacetylase [Desulfopila sp.]
MNKKCGLLFDDRYFKHSITHDSPENPKRLYSLYSSIQEKFKKSYYFLQPRPAAIDTIMTVHSSFYLEQVRHHSTLDNPFSYDRDTYLMQESLATAQLAAGGCLEMADNIMAGEFNSGFALIRPPGHHAEPGRGMGFCILNNIAITAQYLLDCYKLQRILILDFDAHHGNGTQEIFYESGKVLFVSLHQDNLFPFSGKVEEVGKEDGEGYTINIPVFAQFGDQQFTFLIGRLLQGLMEQYMPQIILVSAGYDGHRHDTISNTTLSTEWFGTITTMLQQYAADVCDRRLMFVLEGGYNPVSLEASVIATLESLQKSNSGKIGVLNCNRAAALLDNHPLKRYWTIQ